MSGLLRITNVLYWLALTAWIGAIIAAAVSAMNVFGTMPEMAIENARFAALPAAEQGRATAGVVMAQVFATVDTMQIVAAPVAVAALLAQLFLFGQCPRRPAHALRAICIVTAAILLGYYAAGLSGELSGLLQTYWACAETGDLAGAAEARSAFVARHGVAERLLQVNLVLLVTAVAASAVAFTPSRAAGKCAA